MPSSSFSTEATSSPADLPGLKAWRDFLGEQPSTVWIGKRAKGLKKDPFSIEPIGGRVSFIVGYNML